MTEYKWVVNALDCVPQEGTMLDVVTVVHWTRCGKQYVGAEPILVSVYGTIRCESPSKTDFTAYEDLTYEQVCGWLDAAIDVEALDLGLDQQIENQVNPPIIILPLPFVNP